MNVTLAKGKSYEKEIEVKQPVGRTGRKKFAPLMAFMMELTQFENNPGKMLAFALNHPDYEDVYVPLALGMDNKEGHKWLDENGTPMEIFQSFMEAVQIIMSNETDREDVATALKK